MMLDPVQPLAHHRGIQPGGAGHGARDIVDLAGVAQTIGDEREPGPIAGDEPRPA